MIKKPTILIILFHFLGIGTALSQQVQFQEVTVSANMKMSSLSRWSTRMAWGDFNNDGLLDVYVTAWGQASTGEGRNALYQNMGGGVFSNVAASKGLNLLENSSCAAWGDFDNDGDLDLFVANFYEGDMVFKNLFIETGVANFTNVTTSMNFINEAVGRSKSAVWGDYNNDGYLDLYVSKYWGKNALYRNNGGTSFTLVTGAFSDIRDSEYATWTDYDNDGDVDLYVVNREQENRLFRNDNGTLTPIFGSLSNTQFGRFAVWADYDNNGLLDLFLGNIGANAFYRQNPAGIFTEIAGSAGVKSAPNAWNTWGATWGDYDADGDLDLFFVGGFDETEPSTSFTGTYGNILLENTGGTFVDKTIQAGLLRGAKDFSKSTEVASFASAASFVDYDNDGDLDLMVTNTFQNLLYKNLLYENLNPTNKCLKVRVQGKGAGFNNRNGFGAKVRVYSTSAPGILLEMREITSGPEPAIAYFALPQAGTYRVEVTFLKNGSQWPQTITLMNITVPYETVVIQP
jgi:hypothetical protein